MYIGDRVPIKPRVIVARSCGRYNARSKSGTAAAVTSYPGKPGYPRPRHRWG